MKPFWRIFLFLLVFTACLAYMSRVVCDFGVAYWHKTSTNPKDYGVQWKLKCRDYEYPQDLPNAQPYYSTEEIHKI